MGKRAGTDSRFSIGYICPLTISHMYKEHLDSLTKSSFLSFPPLSSPPPPCRSLSPIHAFLFHFVILIYQTVCDYWVRTIHRSPMSLPSGAQLRTMILPPSLPHIPSLAKSSLGSDSDPEPSLRRKPRPGEIATCTLSCVNSSFQSLP